jgi:hypothetical protein
MPPKIIAVPKTDSSAFNPSRPAGKLLQAQTAHLREALINHLREVATLVAIDIKSLKTEGDVGAYARKVTAILHPQGVRRPGK